MTKRHLLKVSRLEGLTDGVFAIAMTILALDLHIPAQLKGLPLGPLLLHTIPIKLTVYVGSFIILGTLWVAMTFQTGLLERINRPYLWSHVLYLMAVCVVPFSASLVAAYPQSAVSISVFAVNLLCASLTQFLIINCAHRFHLNNTIYSDAARGAAVKRIFIAPVFYIMAIFVSHWYPSIAFMLLVIPILVYIFPGKIDKYNTSLDDLE